MPGNRQGNPTNSPVIQAIIDAIDVARDVHDNDAATKLQAALSALQRNKRLTHNADAKYNAHRYPDKSITYTKVATYDQCPARFNLSRDAQSLLSWMGSVVSQDGLVCVPQSYMASILRISNRQQLRRAINELIQDQYIVIYDQPTKGTHQATTYMMDHRIIRSGKDPNDNDIDNYITLTTRHKDKLHTTTAYQQAIITQKRPYGKNIRIGTVVPTNTQTDTKEKEPVRTQQQRTSSKSKPKPPIESTTNDTINTNNLSIPAPDTDIDDIMLDIIGKEMFV